MAPLIEPPRISTEVAENIIDQLARDVPSLRSCALTCHGWRPRARYHLMVSIRVQSTDDLSSLREYFKLNPDIAGLVRTLSVDPDPFRVDSFFNSNDQSLLEAPAVMFLASQLSKLQRYSMQSFYTLTPNRALSLHAITLCCIKKYLHVQELTIGPLVFRSGSDLAQLLVALPLLRCLECRQLYVRDMGNREGDLTGTARFRDRCSQLSEATICETPLIVVSFILEMSFSALEVLRCDLDKKDLAGSGEDSYRATISGGYREDGNSAELPELKRLHTLEFMTGRANESTAEYFNHITNILSTSVTQTLCRLTITFTSTPPDGLGRVWGTDSVLRQGNLLEDVILTRKLSRVTVSLPGAKPNRLGIWSRRIRHCFPRLHEGDILQVQCSSPDVDGKESFGHDAGVSAMATSRDGRYIATGAQDGTVIVWSTVASQRALLELHSPGGCEIGGIKSLWFSDTADILAAGTTTSSVLTCRLGDDPPTMRFAAGEQDLLSCGWYGASPNGRLYTLGVASLDGYRSLVFSIISVNEAQTEPLWTPVFHDAGDSHIPSSLHGYGSSIRGRLGQYYQSVIGQWSRDLFVAAGFNAMTCTVWRGDPKLRLEIYLTYRHTAPTVSPSCASFVGDDLLVILFNDGTICWWDISPVPSTPNARAPCGFLVLERIGPPGLPLSLSVSPLHSFLVVCGDRTVPVFKRETTLREREGSRDGFSLHVILQGHTDNVFCASVSPCERYIATGSKDTTVCLWSARDGSLMRTFADHNKTVVHVIFSTDGRILASGDIYGKVCLHLVSEVVRDAPL